MTYNLYIKKWILGFACMLLFFTAFTTTPPSVIISMCEGTVNLTTHVTSSALPGTVITYHSGTPATNANKLTESQYTNAAAGVYYSAFYDQTNDCYSPTSIPLYVMKCISNDCPSAVVNLNEKFSFPSFSSPVEKRFFKLNGYIGFATDVTPTVIAALVTEPTEVSEYGIYFAALYDTANDCYSPSSQPIDIRITNCIIAKDDISQTPMNVPVSGNVLLNDDNIGGGDLDVQIMKGFDANGNLITISTDSNNPTTIYAPDPNNSGSYILAGTLSINHETGDFNYIPANNYTGVVPVVYTAVNESGQTDDANLTITVIPESTALNNPPVANDDTNTVKQGESVTTVVLSNDSDPDDDELSVQYIKGYNSSGQLVNISTTVSSPTTVYAPHPLGGGSYIVAGTAALNESGELIFTANDDYVGLVPFEYSITDGNGGTDQANVTIRVLADDENSSNNSTVANDDANIGYPQQLMTGNILDNDTDKEGNPTTVTDARSSSTVFTIGQITTLSDGSTLKINADGTYEYVAGPGVVETKVVTYTKCDNGTPQACDQATLLLTTLRRPNTTNAENDINQTPENTPLKGNILTNDSDKEGDTQSIVSILADTNGNGSNDNPLTVGSTSTIYGTDENGSTVIAGTIKINADGSYDYVPATNFRGDLNLVYGIEDDNTNKADDTAILSIEVNGENANDGKYPPIAQDDAVKTEKDQNVIIPILSNDSDIDGNLVASTVTLNPSSVPGAVCNVSNSNGCTKVTVPNEGTYTTNPDGTVTFDPVPTFVGTTTPLKYRVCDNDAKCDEANITVEITDPTRNEMASDDDANIGFNDEVLTGNVITNDIDPDGSTGTPSVSSAKVDSDGDGIVDDNLPLATQTTIYGPNPSNPSQSIIAGTIVLNGDGSYTYNPDDNFTGTVNVPYTVCDNDTRNACSTSTLHLTVVARNTTIAEDDVNQTPKNTKLLGDVSTNDRDEEGDTQSVTSIMADTDGDGNIDDAVAVGTVTTIYGNDTDGNRVQAGTIKLNSDGTYEYTPATDFTGEVPLNYTVTDANGATDPADVLIKVVGEDDNLKYPPIAIDDHVKTDPDVNVVIPVLANDSDVDGNLVPSVVALNPQSVSGAICAITSVNGCVQVTVPNEGTFTVNSNGTVTFDPNSNFRGTTTPLEYSVKDNDGLVAKANITVEITDATVNEMDSDDDANSGYNDEQLTGNILTNDIDPDGSSGTPSVSQILADTDGDGESDDVVTAGTATNIYGPNPENPSTMIVAGSITLNSDGTYTFDPSSEFVGTTDVPYTVCDNDARNACSSSTLHLTVVSRNATIAEDDVNQTPKNTKLFGDVSTNDRDEEGDNQTVTSVKGDTDGDGNVDDPISIGSLTTVYGKDTDGNIVVAGTVFFYEAGKYEYTPATDFTGEVPLNYTVTDAKGATDPADVLIKVFGEDDNLKYPPIAIDDHVKTDPDVNVVIPVLANDSDIDGNIEVSSVALNPQSIPGATCTNTSVNGCIQVTVPNEGTFTVNANGTVTFDPTSSFRGTTTPLEYSVKDNDGLIAKANITVEITDAAVNEMDSDDDANSGYNDEQLTGNILTNDIDPDGSSGTPSVSEILADTNGNGESEDVVTAGTPTDIYGPDPANPSSKIIAGRIRLNSDGTYTFDPRVEFVGTVDVPYTVCDNDTRNACSSSTLHLTVVARNATIAIDDINQTPINTKLFGDVSTNDRDKEGDNQTVTAVLGDTDGDGNVDDVVVVGTETTVYGDDESGNRVEAGTIKLNSDGTYEYTPATDFTGEVPLNYTVTDTKGATDDADVSIKVVGETSEGFPPIAQDDRVFTGVDENVTLPILVNDSDIDGNLVENTIRLNEASVPGATCNIPLNGCLQVVIPNEGTFTVNTGNGTVLFDPLPAFRGETTPLEYKVCDNDGKCTEANITVVIEDPAVNEMASDDDANSGYNDEQLSGNILTNDIDPDGSTGTPSVSEILADTDGDGDTDDTVTAGTATDIYGPDPADPSSKIVAGSLTLNSDGTYTFDPSSAFTGTVDVPYTVCDNDTRNACSSSTLHLTVVARNTTIAIDDINQTPKNTKLFGDVSTNDRDKEGDDQTVTAILGDTDGDGNVDDVVVVGTETTVYGDDESGNRVEAGTIKLNSDGTYEYTPATDFTGDVPLNYTVTDTKGATDDADVIIKVVGATDSGFPPIAQDDRVFTGVDENVTLPILVNDSDIDGNLVENTIRLNEASVPGATCNIPLNGCLQVVIPNEGTFTVNTGNGTVLFDPLPAFRGETTPLEYKVCDNDGKCTEANITVVIEDPAVNEMASDDDANSGYNDEQLSGNILTNDIDPDGSTGTPSVSEILADTDGDGDTDDTVTAGTATDIYGPDPADPSSKIVAGSITLNSDGTYTFDPNTAFTGTVDVPYTVCDNDTRNACSSSTLHLTVVARNTTIAIDDFNQTPINTKLFGDVSTNDRDDQGDNQTVTAVLGDTDGDGDVDDVVVVGTETTVYGDDASGNRVVAGTIELNSDGTYEYTPATDFTGHVPLNYTVTDDNVIAATDTADVMIIVIGETDDNLYPPVAQDDRRYTQKDVNVDLPLLSNDSDVDGTLVNSTIRLIESSVPGASCVVNAGGCLQVIIPNEGTFTVNTSDEKVTFDPLPEFVGETTPLKYKVCDNDALCAEAYLTVVIEDSTKNEMASDDDANSGFNTETLTGNILTNDIDPDGSSGTPSVSEIKSDSDGDGLFDDVLSAGTGTQVYGPDPQNPASKIIAGELTVNTDGTYTFVPSTEFTGTIDVPYTVCDNDARNACSSSTLHLTVVAGCYELSIRMYLQGALINNGGEVGSTGRPLMRDNLRKSPFTGLNYIPTTEPYSALNEFTHVGRGGGEQATATAFDDRGENSVVDWVFIEFRSKTDSVEVLETRSALLQRDGDVVEVDGISPLVLCDYDNQYFIVVRHRNHLGAMTAGKETMSRTGVIIDFTDSNVNKSGVYNYGANHPDAVGLENYTGYSQATILGVRALWAGNVNGDNKVKYQGSGNDRTNVLSQVLSYPSNTANTYNFNIGYGYFTGDVDLNSKVKYQGSQNDRNLILNFILTYDLNDVKAYNYNYYLEQLPK